MWKLKIQDRFVTTLASIAIASIFIFLMVVELHYAGVICMLIREKLIYTYKAMNYSPFVLLAGLGFTAFMAILMGYTNVRLLRILKIKFKQDSPILVGTMLASIFLLSVWVELVLIGVIGGLLASHIGQTMNNRIGGLSTVIGFLTLIVLSIGANILLAHKIGQDIFKQSAWLMAAITTVCWGGIALGVGYNSMLAIMIIIGVWIAAIAALNLRKSKKLQTLNKVDSQNSGLEV